MATDKAQSMCPSFWVFKPNIKNSIFVYFMPINVFYKQQYNLIGKLKDAKMPPDNAKLPFLKNYHKEA